MRWIYDILFFFFALLYLPFFFMKGKYKDGFASRFGIVPEKMAKTLKAEDVLWVHGVSVGEVVQAVRLIDALRTETKYKKFLLTTTTSAGMEIARSLASQDTALLYFPVDFRFAVRSFVKQVNPKAVIILETEIWPNLTRELFIKKIPIFLVNARISDKAIGKYKMFRFFLGGVLKQFTGIYTQNQRMKDRFIALGAQKESVLVSGNMKFDWKPQLSADATLQKLTKFFKESAGFFMIAGSTHEGEEKIVFSIYQSLRMEYPSLRLLIAPRHLGRLSSIETQAKALELTPIRTSQMISQAKQEEASIHAKDVVYLLDQMGILSRLYACADAVFIGGSLVPFGGHNLVEAAYYAKPILFGPHMNNFLEMASEFKDANAAIELHDAAQFKKELIGLIQDEPRRKSLGEAAKTLLSLHQGATNRNVKSVAALLQ